MTLNDDIYAIKRAQDAVNATAKDSKEVKDGTVTEDEELKEPAYVLFNGIAETSIKILGTPSVATIMNEIGGKMGEETAKHLTELISICMTNSAYMALTFYDDLLKEELNKHFQNVDENFIKLSADINAHTGVLEVFKKRLSELEKKELIDDIK